jgi:hypothetical protein
MGGKNYRLASLVVVSRASGGGNLCRALHVAPGTAIAL